MEYRSGIPDFAGNFIQAFEAGQRNRQRNKLAEIDEMGRRLSGEVLAGNKNRLADLMAVDPDRGMKIQQFTDQQKKDFIQDFASQAYAADSPETWLAMIGRYKQQGHVFDPGEDDFANRDALISRAMSISDSMGLDLRREDAKRAQANADRSYNLQERGFKADQDWRQTQAGIERDKLSKPDLTDDMKEYQFYTSQTRASGQQPLSFNDWMTGMKRANATQVNMGGGSDKQIFDALDASASTARAAVNGLAGIREAKKAIAGGIISGAYADQRLALQKVGSLIGVADPTTIVNTETFRSAIAPQVSAW